MFCVFVRACQGNQKKAPNTCNHFGIFFFLNCCLAALQPTFGYCWGGSLIFTHTAEGHGEPHSEVGSLSPVEHLVGFEPGTFWFWLQRLNPLGHSPLMDYKAPSVPSNAYGPDEKACWKISERAKLSHLQMHTGICCYVVPRSFDFSIKLALFSSIWKLSFCPSLSLTHCSWILMMVYLLSLACWLLACWFFLYQRIV